MAQVYVIGRVTADPELKVSGGRTPYVRFDVAENIGYGQNRRTQYLQICAFGKDAERLVRARVKKGSLLRISGSLELELYTKKDGVTTDKRLKVLLDNWDFLPIGNSRSTNETAEKQSSQTFGMAVTVVDGDRESLPG